MGGESPVTGAGAPGSGEPRTLFLTAFTIGFSRFEVHFRVALFGFQHKRQHFGTRLVW